MIGLSKYLLSSFMINIVEYNKQRTSKLTVLLTENWLLEEQTKNLVQRILTQEEYTWVCFDEVLKSRENTWDLSQNEVEELIDKQLQIDVQREFESLDEEWKIQMIRENFAFSDEVIDKEVREEIKEKWGSFEEIVVELYKKVFKKRNLDPFFYSEKVIINNYTIDKIYIINKFWDSPYDEWMKYKDDSDSVYRDSKTFKIFITSSLTNKSKKEIILEVFKIDTSSARYLTWAITLKVFLDSSLTDVDKNEILTYSLWHSSKWLQQIYEYFKIFKNWFINENKYLLLAMYSACEVADEWEVSDEIVNSVKELVLANSQKLYDDIFGAYQNYLETQELSWELRWLLYAINNNGCWSLSQIESLAKFFYQVVTQIENEKVNQETKKEILSNNIQLQNKLLSTLDRWWRHEFLFFLKDFIKISPKLFNSISEFILRSFENKVSLNIIRYILHLYNTLLLLSEWENEVKYLDDIEKNLSDLISNIWAPWFIENHISQLKGLITLRFKEIFSISWEEISFDQIESLENLWGNLDEIFVLISRFNWNSEWKEEIPILATVVKHVLKWTFWDLKYTWDNDEVRTLSKEQLSWLNERQLKAWQTNPYRLDIINQNSSSELTDENLFRIGKNEFQEQIINQKHIDSVKAWLSKELVNFQITENESKLCKRLETRQIKIKWLMQELNDKKRTLLILLQRCLQSKDKQTFEFYIDILNSWIPWVDLSWIKDDLTSIKQKLKWSKWWKDFICFSTVFDDPKMLLWIWDLVATHSCQNYRIWDYIQTLLWYVIDANVKWIASFTISQRDFSNQADYIKVKEIVNAWTYELNFDFAKRILTINWIKIKLNKAISRQVVKYWKTDDWESAIFCERAYLNTHYWLNSINNTQISLVSDFAKNIWISIVNGWISFPKSKNIWWVYSDAWGWVVWVNEWYTV